MLSSITLNCLHERTVQVEFEINRQTRRFCGTAQYLFWPDAGWVLRISIDDLPGNFSFVIREADWQGEILPSHSPNYDYHICLTQLKTVSNSLATG